MKNTLEVINNRLYRTHKWSERQNNGNHPINTAKIKSLKNENSLRDHWDNIRCNNICIIGVSEGDEREKKVKNVFHENMAEYFPNLKKETDV